MTGWMLEEMQGEAWAMEPQRLAALVALAERAGALEKRDLAAAIASSRAGSGMDDDEEPLYERMGRAARVRVSGVLVKSKPWWFAWLGVDATETPRIRESIVAALEDEEVDAIVLHVSSPGGQAQGVADVADAIKDACKSKTVECVVDGLCASGAYWLASQADAIVANKDAYVGSIGVYQVVVDSSKAAEAQGYRVHVVRSGEHKGMGVPGAPITDAQLAATQEVVDDFAAIFKKAVKSGRELDDVDAIATGQVWLAKSAKNKGLVDDVETVHDALDRLSQDPDDQEDDMPPKNKKAAAEGAPDTIDLAALERARVAEFKLAFPKDLAFAIEQFESGATIEQAKAAYSEILEEQLEASEKEKATAKAELAEARKPRPAAPAAGTPVPFGGEPGTAPKADFVAEAKAYAKEHGVKLHEAMSTIARRDPAAHHEWKENVPLVKKNPDRGYERVARPS